MMGEYNHIGQPRTLQMSSPTTSRKTELFSELEEGRAPFALLQGVGGGGGQGEPS